MIVQMMSINILTRCPGFIKCSDIYTVILPEGYVDARYIPALFIAQSTFSVRLPLHEPLSQAMPAE